MRRLLLLACGLSAGQLFAQSSPPGPARSVGTVVDVAADAARSDALNAARDAEADMMREMYEAFTPIHARHGHPKVGFFITNDEQSRLKIAPSVEAVNAAKRELAATKAELEQAKEDLRLVRLSKTMLAEDVAKAKKELSRITDATAAENRRNFVLRQENAQLRERQIRQAERIDQINQLNADASSQ